MTVDIDIGAPLAFDRASVRSYDRDGRLHVAHANISKATVNEYKGSEIPGAEAMGLEPDRRYRLFRDPAELEKAAATFNNLPILSKHVAVSADAPRPDLVIGSTGTDAKFEAPYLTNSLVFWTRDAIDAIESEDARELSCAYHYVPVLEAGVYEDQPYDMRMTKIIGNHVCLVPEGRAGEDVMVGDAKPTDDLFQLEDKIMPKANQALSRKAQVVRGALAAYLAPKLAADQQVDLKSVVLGTTALNYASAKQVIAARLQSATQGKLAKDANLKDVHGLLDRLDGEGADETDDTPRDLRTGELDPEQDTDNPAVDADNMICEKICKMLEGKVPPEVIAEVRKLCEEPAADWDDMDDTMPSDADLEGKSPEDQMKMMREARDRMMKDKAAKDKIVKVHGYKRNIGEAKDKKARDAAGMETATEEMKKAAEAKDKKAMDAALAVVAENTRRSTIAQMREIAEAEKVVAPYIGPVAIAQDSAEATYRLALDTMKVDVTGVHPSAYKHILLAQPRPGRDGRSAEPRIATDAAVRKDFETRLPEFNRLKRTVA